MRMLIAGAVTLLAMGCSSAASDEPGTVTRADLGDAWPLTVDEVELRCEPFTDGVSLPLMVGPDGTEYGLTGQAVTQGYAELDASNPLWADNPSISGAKVNISPLRQRALELCE